MIFRTIVVTPFMQNCRVILDESRKLATIVDPGGDIDAVLAALRVDGESFAVEQVLLTHAHVDHAGGVAVLLRRLQAAGSGEVRQAPPLLGHRDDAPLRRTVAEQALMFGIVSPEIQICPEPDRYIEEGDMVSCGSIEAKVLFVPGHAPGHVAFFFANLEESLLQQVGPDGGIERETRVRGPLLIGGDTLFEGSIGRTDLPGGDAATLIRSIREKLLTLPDETRVLSGHGGDTTIGRERTENPFVGSQHGSGRA